MRARSDQVHAADAAGELLPAAAGRHADAAVGVRRHHRGVHTGVFRGSVGEEAVRVAHGGGGIRGVLGVHTQGGGGGEGGKDSGCVDEDSQE